MTVKKIVKVQRNSFEHAGRIIAPIVDPEHGRGWSRRRKGTKVARFTKTKREAILGAEMDAQFD